MNQALYAHMNNKRKKKKKSGWVAGTRMGEILGYLKIMVKDQ
jgi:hypothetical protein